MESVAGKALKDIDGALTTLISEIDDLDKAVREVDKKVGAVRERFTGLNNAVCRPDRQPCDHYLAAKEPPLPATLAVIAFTVFALALMGGVIVYCAWGHPGDAIEYSSFSFGCTAAITAGLTIYFERYRTSLFFVSFLMLCLSTLTFIESHSQDVLVVSVSIWIVCGSTFVIYAFYRAYLVWTAAKSEGLSQGVVMSAIGSFLVLVLLFMLIFYLYSFLKNNFNCINEKAPLSSCQGVWRFW